MTVSSDDAAAAPEPQPETPADAETAVVVAEAPAEAAPVEAAPPKRKRRGWLIALIVVGVLVVLGVVAFLIADAVAKDYAKDYVRARIVEVLRLPADADVAVDLGGGSMILQALAGRVDTVDVEVPDAAFGDLNGRLELHAEGVPLDAAAAVDVLGVEFSLAAEDLAALSQGEDTETAPDFAIVDGELTLSSEFELFGVMLPWGLAAVPSAADAELVLTPTRLTIGEATFTAGEDDDSFLGLIAQALLQPQSLCVASEVPQALTLVDAAVAGEELVLSFRGDGASLGGVEFSTPGTCPED